MRCSRVRLGSLGLSLATSGEMTGCVAAANDSAEDPAEDEASRSEGFPVRSYPTSTQVRCVLVALALVVAGEPVEPAEPASYAIASIVIAPTRPWASESPGARRCVSSREVSSTY